MKLAYYKSAVKGSISDILVHKLTCWWTGMKYSHVEVILEEHSDGSVTIATSSPRDNGVRTQRLKLKPEHWDIVEYSDLPKSPEEVKKWFKDNEGV